MDVPTFLQAPSADYRPCARLADCSTFRLGGPCRGLLTCRTPDQLTAAVRGFHEADESFVLVGGGSNILFSDQGVVAHVLRYATEAPDIQARSGRVWVSGATSLDALVEWTVELGWEGVSFCSGIPGTVGGAVAGNAGAWGQQIAEALHSVSLLDRTGREREVDPASLRFTYRNSMLKDGSDIVLGVALNLKPSDRSALRAERQQALAIRAEKHPHLDETPSIGSFFKNIEPTSAAERRQAAGWFLEQAGAGAFRVGGARLFPKHANIIIADPGCRAVDVYNLSCMMADAVHKKFGLNLTREARLLGPFPGVDAMSATGFF